MFYTTGELPMSGAQKTALFNFVRSGRGFLVFIRPPTHLHLPTILI